MSQIAQIEELCDRWIASVNQADGALAFGPASEQHRLLENGVVFHELSFHELQSAIVALARTLLQPRLSTFIAADHLFLWSWLAELLRANTMSSTRSREYLEADNLLLACIRVALAPSRPRAADLYTLKLQQQIEQLIPFHLSMLGSEAHHLLPYPAFASLEGQLRIGCAAYVDMSGKVRRRFSVPDVRGKMIAYDPKGKSRCSSIRDMLLLYASSAPKAVVERVEAIRTHIAYIAAAADGFSVIYNWRNSSLHGEMSLPTIGGTILNLTLLIALQQLEPSFETHRAETWRGVEWDMKTSRSGSRSPWSFYPPW